MNRCITPFFVSCILAASLVLGHTFSTMAQAAGWQSPLAIDEGQLTPGGAFYQKPMRWLRELGLSEAQQDQIYKIIYERAPSIREQMKVVRRAHEELDKLAGAARFDAVRAREVAEVGAKALVEVALARADVMNRILGILTPDQRARMDRQLAPKQQQ